MVDYIKVSVGELVDKYSILELKKSFIEDTTKLYYINNELSNLECANKYIEKYPTFYKLLVEVNKKIWNLTNIVKNLDANCRHYAPLSCKIFELNQQRFRIKNFFNTLFSDSLKEQKSYENIQCWVAVKSISSLYDNWSRFLDLCIQYDNVYLSSLVAQDYNQCYQFPPNVYMNESLIPLNESLIPLNESLIPLNESLIPLLSKGESYSNVLTNAVSFSKPIVYVATGLLGDFIMQLSVVCENYYKTGQKGIVYMTGPYFKNGIQSTYNDIADVIKSQIYIEDLRIGEPECDVYLSSWRQRPDFYTMNWYQLFKEEYDIELGKHCWLDVPVLPEWTCKTVVHISQYRFPPREPRFPPAPSFPLRELCSRAGLSPAELSHREVLPRETTVSRAPDVLLELMPGDHAMYEEKIGNIDVYRPKSFAELCSIIYSCKSFIGALSMPLTIAHAANVPRIVKLCGVTETDTMNIGLKNCMENIFDEL